MDNRANSSTRSLDGLHDGWVAEASLAMATVRRAPETAGSGRDSRGKIPKCSKAMLTGGGVQKPGKVAVGANGYDTECQGERSFLRGKGRKQK